MIFSALTLQAMQEVAKRFAEVLVCGDMVALKGNLGAGKTTFTRFVIQALVGDLIEVVSPTFTLCQQYDTPKGMVYHYDLYRLASVEEVEALGLFDHLREGITLIEWPELIMPYLPPAHYQVELSGGTLENRTLVISSRNLENDTRICATLQELGKAATPGEDQ